MGYPAGSRIRYLTLIAALTVVPAGGVPALSAQAQPAEGAPMSKDDMDKDGMSQDGMKDGAMAGPAMVKGRFHGADGHDAKGSFELSTKEGKTRLALGSDFKVDRGPDVYLVLSRLPKVAESGDLYLGKLEKFKGQQEYDVPAGADLAAYQHLVLWCKKYSVAMGIAALASDGDAMHK